MKISYVFPPGVQYEETIQPVLTTPEHGMVSVDGAVYEIWKFAGGRSLDEIIAHFSNSGLEPGLIQAVVGCLVEAGLLNRLPEAPRQQKFTPITGKPVSAVILAYEGRDWLEECIPSLLAQTYAPIEIIVVDNASPEPIGPWLAKRFPQAKIISLTAPVSIAAAYNRGIAAAQGEYFLILNQDVRLEPDAVAEMIAVIDRSPECACVAPKLRFYWAKAFLNGIGNRVQRNDFGSDNGIGRLDLGQYDHWEEVPSACFAAALVRRECWQAVGPMDEDFPMYYEDTEWAYRARILGYTIKAAPGAVVYHAFGGRIPSGKPGHLSPRKLRNVVYGRYRFTLKLLSQYRGRLLRNYVLMDFARFLKASLIGNWPYARAYLDAWNSIAGEIAQLGTINSALSTRRAIKDEALFNLQIDFQDSAMVNDLPDLRLERIKSDYFPLLLSKRTRQIPEMNFSSEQHPKLLIISNDIVNEKMGGPGMRYVEISRVLSGPVEVTLAAPNETALVIPGVQIRSYRENEPSTLKSLVDRHEIVLISGYMLVRYPFLYQAKARLVVDLYDPFFLENLFYYLDQPVADQVERNTKAIEAANRLLQIGDFFICGTERQRDFWLGMLAANGRINPQTFGQDQALHSLVDVVGVGYRSQPLPDNPVVRGSLVPHDAKIVLWGGGIWNWLDPLTLVRAWPRVAAAHPDAKLIFLGTRNPNPAVPEHRMAMDTIRLAEQIGEKDRSIFFIEWLPYPEHQVLLREADIGVTFQPAHVETRFAIRTRVIDYFGAGLPCLVSDGDITAEWVNQYRVGRTVPCFDIEALACALIEMLTIPRQAYLESFEALRPIFTWENVVEPLRKYCLEGGTAADKNRGSSSHPANIGQYRHDNIPARAYRIFREKGFFALIQRGFHHLTWRMFRK